MKQNTISFRNGYKLLIEENSQCETTKANGFSCFDKYYGGSGNGLTHLMNRSCDSCFNFYEETRKKLQENV